MTNDYISKQDAKDALQEKVFHNLTNEFYGAMQVLDELEPADVVPVVRCRDCKYYGIRLLCNLNDNDFHWCNLNENDFEPDDFCSYGDRREE